MPIEKLDLKSIWNAGLGYETWLADVLDSGRRQEMERFYIEANLSVGEVEFLKKIKRPVHLLAISEDWCGDVRRNLPVAAKLCAENQSMLRLKIVDKDSRPELMVRYLTNGAEAIPIVIFMNDAFVEVGNWGPRPSECKRLMARGKSAGKVDVARARIGEFYAQDKHRSTIEELSGLIEIASAVEV